MVRFGKAARTAQNLDVLKKTEGEDDSRDSRQLDRGYEFQAHGKKVSPHIISSRKGIYVDAAVLVSSSATTRPATHNPMTDNDMSRNPWSRERLRSIDVKQGAAYR